MSEDARLRKEVRLPHHMAGLTAVLWAQWRVWGVWAAGGSTGKHGCGERRLRNQLVRALRRQMSALHALL